MQQFIDNIKTRATLPLLTPAQLIEKLPLNAIQANTVSTARITAANIIQGDQSHLLVITGPCSIHDVDAALEYAELLHKQAARFADELFIMMRVYFEKPRTVLGWSGLISDPYLDETFDINHGLHLARELLLEIIGMGVPTATEFLDTLIPVYLSDLICWNAVGARTVESQIHRQLTSGLIMPVGFKNTTDGNIKIAVDAVKAARHAHHFIGFSDEGTPSIVVTRGNKNGHIILRGSHAAQNYSAAHVAESLSLLKNENLPQRVMIDCSHGNSMKDYRQQKKVVEAIAAQMGFGRNEILGVMLESHLVGGSQLLSPGKKLVYGQSITDACVSWDETVLLLEKLAKAVKKARKNISQKNHVEVDS
jgi:3-deoxy-7-phosphoheptulonate synthase